VKAAKAHPSTRVFEANEQTTPHLKRNLLMKIERNVLGKPKKRDNG